MLCCLGLEGPRKYLDPQGKKATPRHPNSFQMVEDWGERPSRSSVRKAQRPGIVCNPRLHDIPSQSIHLQPLNMSVKLPLTHLPPRVLEWILHTQSGNLKLHLPQANPPLGKGGK